MRKKKIALYDPYLDTLGGGEKHILSILKVFENNEYEIIIFWNEDLQNKIENFLDLKFKNKIHFKGNIFSKNFPVFEKLRLLREFDYFFYVTDGSYFFSSAKKNYIFSMYPKKQIYNMNFINKLKTINWKFISNSIFTKENLLKFGVNSEVIYPFITIDYDYLNKQLVKKDKIILTVGRFYNQLHSKRQDISIKMFKQLLDSAHMFKDFKLILAGGLKEEDNNYLIELKKLAKGLPIDFKINIKRDELINLYKKSMFYWHMTGFDVDEKIDPEKTEHLGITPLEAMSYKCIVFSYNAGGQKELINDSDNGFLFNNSDELFEKMNKVYEDQSFMKEVLRRETNYVIKNFSYSSFVTQVEDKLQI